MFKKLKEGLKALYTFLTVRLFEDVYIEESQAFDVWLGCRISYIYISYWYCISEQPTANRILYGVVCISVLLYMQWLSEIIWYTVVYFLYCIQGLYYLPKDLILFPSWLLKQYYAFCKTVCKIVLIPTYYLIKEILKISFRFFFDTIKMSIIFFIYVYYTVPKVIEMFETFVKNFVKNLYFNLSFKLFNKFYHFIIIFYNLITKILDNAINNLNKKKNTYFVKLVIKINNLDKIFNDNIIVLFIKQWQNDYKINTYTYYLPIIVHIYFEIGQVILQLISFFIYVITIIFKTIFYVILPKILKELFNIQTIIVVYDQKLNETIIKLDETIDNIIHKIFVKTSKTIIKIDEIIDQNILKIDQKFDQKFFESLQISGKLFIKYIKILDLFVHNNILYHLAAISRFFCESIYHIYVFLYILLYKTAYFIRNTYLDFIEDTGIYGYIMRPAWGKLVDYWCAFHYELYDAEAFIYDGLVFNVQPDFIEFVNDSTEYIYFKIKSFIKNYLLRPFTDYNRFVKPMQKTIKYNVWSKYFPLGRYLVTIKKCIGIFIKHFIEHIKYLPKIIKEDYIKYYIKHFIKHLLF